MIKFITFIIFIVVCIPSSALEYKMIKGDTLWSLSKVYLKNPYLWKQITYVDGKTVSEPRSMPIGTLLLIKKGIANEHALSALVKKDINLKPTSPTSFVVNPSIQKMLKNINNNEKNRLLDYYLTNKEGLVRAFYNGQEVVIDVQIIIDQLSHLEGKHK